MQMRGQSGAARFQSVSGRGAATDCRGGGRAAKSWLHPEWLIGRYAELMKRLRVPPRAWRAACFSIGRMDPLTAIAASGMRARMESLDMLANNVANASTGGYKADREFYGLYVAPEAGENDPPAAMPVIERPWTDLSQGVIHPTGNTLDVALNGPGFFAVSGPGGTLYTRNGSFSRAADGKLVTAEGYTVQNTQGAALVLEPAEPVDISDDGTVWQDGQAIGQLAVMDFTTAGNLAKQGASYFRASGSASRARAVVEQGRLEDSNTGPAESAVRLVSVMRQFEMLQKAVALGTEMSRQAIEQVAKVGA
jgi:flagellar basal-body rod protein FlgF